MEATSTRRARRTEHRVEREHGADELRKGYRRAAEQLTDARPLERRHLAHKYKLREDDRSSERLAIASRCGG